MNNLPSTSSNPQSLRVVIADDHPLVRSGVKNALALSSAVILAGEATNSDDALRLCLDLRPDVLLLDINMPGMKTVQVLRILHETLPQLPVLILTAYCDPENVSGMLKAGARGYLLKEEEPETLLEAVLAVCAGRTWISPLAMQALVEELPGDGEITPAVLSEREQEVLRLLAQGLDNPSIANTLSIAEGTVKNHVTNIYEKLDVHSRAEAVAWAWKNGLR